MDFLGSSGSEGHLAFAYRPIPVTPMSVALLILLGIATFVLGPLASPPELWPLGGLCFLPFGLLLVFVVLSHPSPTRIYTEGIAISLPLWRRLLGSTGTFMWDEVVNVYPASYEISGAFLSPFASSAGTLVHTGIGLETGAGKRYVVRFTPGTIRAFRGETAGYAKAMPVVREVLHALGRPLVTRVKRYSDEEVRAMAEQARQPLLGMASIVLAFLAPPILVGIAFLLFPPGLSTLVIATVAAVIPPVVSIILTWRRSRQRSDLLSELSKFQEALRSTP